MANENKDLMTQLAPAQSDIKTGQASGNQAQVDKGMAEQSKILADNGIVYPSGSKGSGAAPGTPLPKSWGGTGIPSGGSGSKSSSTTKSSASSAVAGMSSLAAQQNQAAQEQIKKQADYAVSQGVKELQRAEADAQEQFDTQQKQVDIDEAKALDNQALYAEARGDRGGIGQAQYGQIQATAMNNRRAINSARTKLATDTNRQIADLRAQGEFQKADAILQLTQTYLGQLMDIQKWGAEFTMAEAQFNAQIQQWEQEFEVQKAQLTGTYQGQATLASKTNLAEFALAALESGAELTDAQMKALDEVYHMDATQVSALKAQYASERESEANAAALEMAVKALDLGATLTPIQYSLLINAGWTDAMIKAKQQEVARKNITKDGGGDDSPKATLGWGDVEAWLSRYGEDMADDYIGKNYKALGFKSKSEALSAWNVYRAENGENGLGSSYDFALGRIDRLLSTYGPAEAFEKAMEFLETGDLVINDAGMGKLLSYIKSRTGYDAYAWFSSGLDTGKAK